MLIQSKNSVEGFSLQWRWLLIARCSGEAVSERLHLWQLLQGSLKANVLPVGVTRKRTEQLSRPCYFFIFVPGYWMMFSIKLDIINILFLAKASLCIARMANWKSPERFIVHLCVGEATSSQKLLQSGRWGSLSCGAEASASQQSNTAHHKRFAVLHHNLFTPALPLKIPL